LLQAIEVGVKMIKYFLGQSSGVIRFKLGFFFVAVVDI